MGHGGRLGGDGRVGDGGWLMYVCSRGEGRSFGMRRFAEVGGDAVSVRNRVCNERVRGFVRGQQQGTAEAVHRQGSVHRREHYRGSGKYR